MLSAFTASPLVELQPRDRSRVESLLSYGNRLLVGLNTGTLRVYQINETASEAHNGLDPTSQATNGDADNHEASQRDRTDRKAVELLQEQPKFARYKIEQLAFIKEANLLISLAGSYVSFHDLQTLELQETLAQTRGAVTFAVTSNIEKDEGTEIPTIVSRLAVAVKRRLLLWTWVDSELVQDTGDEADPDVPKELLMPSGVKSLSWASGRRIVVGLSSSYYLADINKMTFFEINGPGSIGGSGKESSRLGMSYIGMGSGPKPLITRLGGDELLLAKDVNTHFMDTNGHSLRRRQIPWTTPPDTLGYSYPYLLALQDPTKGVLEVRSTKTLTLLQSISVPSATIMHIPQPSISLAHAGKGFFVASDHVVWRMIAQTYDSQIDALVDQGQFDEAIVLLEMLEDPLLTDKAGRLRRVKLRKAKKLFEQRNYRDSLDLFTEISSPPEIVIRLYPKSIAGSLSTFVEEPPEEEKEDQRSNEDGSHSPESPGSEESPDIKKNPGTSSYAPSVASIFLGRSSGEDANEPPVTHRKPPIRPTEKALVGKDLEVAVRELRSFLADIRRRFLRFFDHDGNPQPAALKDGAVNNDPFAASVTQLLAVSPNENEESISQKLLEVATVVDTTLFRAYMFTNPAFAGSLFRLANCCDPDVVMTSLEESKRYHDLIDFLYGKRLHRNALEMLRKFGEMTPRHVHRTQEEVIPENTTTEQKQNPITDSMSEASNPPDGEAPQMNGDASHEGNPSSPTTHTPPDQELQPPEEPGDTVPEDLIGPRRTVLYLQHLPPDMIDLILEFARWPVCTDPEIGMEIFLVDTENSEGLPRDKVLDFLLDIDADLAVRYLEHVIGELNDMDPATHTKLLALYYKKTIFLRQNQEHEGKETLQSEFAYYKRRFLILLEESDQYSPVKMLAELPKDDNDFLEARAILFSKMGQHRQALEIYVFKLVNYAQAEAYCNRIHSIRDLQTKTPDRNKSYRSASRPTEQTTANESIYYTLLSLYLQPPHGYSPQYQPAIRLLDHHGSHLPPDSTLSLIPEGLPMKELEYYFTRRMRTSTAIVRQNKIVAGLRKVQNFAAQENLLLGDGLIGGNAGRNRNVTISEGRVCRVCHKRLGGSVISVFPDNTVVHLGCASKRLGP